MISLNPRRAHTNRQQIIRDFTAPRQVKRKRPLEQCPLALLPINLDVRLLEHVLDRARPLLPVRDGLVRGTDAVHLQKCPLPRPHGGDQCPLGVVRVVRQADLLGPLVAELEGQGEVVLLDAAASFVGKGPVVGVGDEVVDLFSGEWEEGLGGG